MAHITANSKPAPSNPVPQAPRTHCTRTFGNSVFSHRKKVLSIEEKIDALELRKNIELSLIEEDEGKTIPIGQAFEEIRQGLVSE